MCLKIQRENCIFSFSKEHKPLVKVSPGKKVEIHTYDCFSNQIQGPEDKLDAMDWNTINPATGPIYIEGACIGDTLKVTIENIIPDGKGVIATEQDLGPLGNSLKGLESMIVPINHNEIQFDSKLNIPINLMIGVIGVAPKDGEVSSGTPGSHGGNMDNNMITKGASLYLPVSVEGALFAIGDVHAAMGDGEIGGSGVECAAFVTVRFEVIKGLKLENPILENDKFFSTIASKKTLDEAADECVKNMASILSDRIDMPFHKISMLMGVTGHCEICQIVDPLKTARFVMPKYALDKYNFKIK